MSTKTNPPKYDLNVLGSGLSGSMLSASLAKHGLDVLKINSASHPRFAIGEATTPGTSFRLKLVSAKYNVPEIENLSTFFKLRDHVSAACHLFGSRPYGGRCMDRNSRNNLLVSLVIFGEGWHNNHHAFPTSLGTEGFEVASVRSGVVRDLAVAQDRLGEGSQTGPSEPGCRPAAAKDQSNPDQGHGNKYVDDSPCKGSSN